MSDKEDGFSFVWKLENFSMFPYQKDEQLVSEKFAIEKFKGVNFCLLMYPKDENDTVDSIAICLCMKPNDPSLKLNICFTIESTEPSRKIIWLMENEVLQSSRGQGYSEIAYLNYIFANKQFYLPEDTLTIRCDISLNEGASEELSVNEESESVCKFLMKSCVSRTCVQVQRRSVPWSIENIKKRIEQQEEISMTLGSALVKAPSLMLTLILNNTSSDDCFKIMIKKINHSSERLFVKCKITIYSAQQQYRVSSEGTHLFQLHDSDVWSFPPFITARMLTDEKYHFVDDTLLLLCEFSYTYKSWIQHLESNYMLFTFEAEGKKKNRQLSSYFEDIYATGKFCDIELKADGKAFPYYKDVLCARSPVFGAMFANDTKEKNSSVVEIDDVDADTLKRLLTYLHSDVVEEDLSHGAVCKLYEVADKYDVASLKRRCSVLLATALSVANACDVLVLADTHQDDILMTATCNFVSCHANEVFFSDQWKGLMEDNPKLTGSIMQQVWLRTC